MPKNSELRSAILDYWYTTAQIVDVGKAWERAGINRLFLSPEVISSTGEMLLKPEIVNKTALSQNHINELPALPCNILLIINRGGNHWTSLAIALSNQQEKINISMLYSDSLGDGKLPDCIQEEMKRIEALFCEKYGLQNIIITQGAYQHAWRQSDMASCGPYALKNGERCLAGAGDEANLGRALIRREQLDVMTNRTAIKGCSRNNKIDDILVFWMMDRLKNNLPYTVFSSADVERICTKYAESQNVNIAEVIQLFIDEYCCSNGSAIHYRPVVSRMRELLHRHEMIRKLITPEQFDAQIKLLRHKNTMKSLELIRLTIAKAAKDDLFSYSIMAEIIDLLARNHVNEVVAKITEIVTDSQVSEPCLLEIAELTGSREIENDYSLKLISLAKAYRAIDKAAKLIKTIDSPADAPTFLLQEQVILVNAAIIRNNASLLMKIVYVLQDFCSALTELVTFGWWEPEFRKINVIEEKLKIRSKDVTEEDYQMELNSIQNLYRAQNILKGEARVQDEQSRISLRST